MNKFGIVFLVAFLFRLSIIQAQKADESILSKSKFSDPTIEARPRALWTWVNGNFDKSSITYELEEAKAKGMGGFDIWDVSCMQDEDSVVPPGEPFMSEKYTDAIAHAIKEATRLGLDIGLIISSGWNSGGAWTKSENATMAIYRSHQIVTGPKKISITLPLPKLPKVIDKTPSVAKMDENGYPVYYKDIVVQAFPLNGDSVISDSSNTIDISASMNAQGELKWKVPPGKWKIVRMVCANTGQPMIAHAPKSKGPMIDHYNPEATEVHIRYFLDKLKQRLGSFKGTAFKYLYTDSYEVRGELWTPLMVEEFKKRFGYSMVPFLPVFEKFTVISKEVTNRFLYDYNQLLSDLIIDSHFIKAKQICEEYGIGYVAEAAGPGQPLHNCPFESLKSSGVLTFPRGEFWHNPKDPKNEIYVIKGVASASHIYNQKYVEAEAFTSTDLWQESLNDLKPSVDRAFCEGLNRINFHTFPHVPRAFGKPGYVYGFGTQVGVTQTWWPKARPFMDYLARCSYMLQHGHFSAEVLYYYGDEAPNFVPDKHIDPSLGFGYDYDVTNTDVILNRLSVRNNKLSLPHGQTYSVLVLPVSKSINIEVLRKIRLLVKAGAVVIGPKPEISVGYKDFEKNNREVREIANEMWGNIDGTNVTENNFGKGKIVFGRTIREVLNSLQIVPDVYVESGIEFDSIDFLHRKTSTEDVYFISSKSKMHRVVKLKLKSNYKNAEVWDPITGKTHAVNFQSDGKQVSLVVELRGNESQFIVISDRVDKNISKQVVLKPIFTDLLSKNWVISFDKNLGGPTVLRTDTLSDLSRHANDSIRDYSGTISYSTTFKPYKKFAEKEHDVFVDLGEVEVVAEVYLNGKSLGTVWTWPFILPLDSLRTKSDNVLKVEVVNRWVNRLIADSKLPRAQRITNTNVKRLPNGWFHPMKDLPNDKYSLPPSGLIGPVKIYYQPKVTLTR